jgi:hypothetical protein
MKSGGLAPSILNLGSGWLRIVTLMPWALSPSSIGWGEGVYGPQSCLGTVEKSKAAATV